MSLGSTADDRLKYGWITRCLLAIPEPWLERWGLKINAAACAFTVIWGVGSMGLSLGGVFRGWGLTPAQGILAQVAWVPVMMVSSFLITARSAHFLAYLTAQRAQLKAFDEGMALEIAQAAFEGVRQAMEGAEAPVGAKGPTIQ